MPSAVSLTTYMVLEDLILAALPLALTVASMTLLKASLVMTRETRSCEVPMLSRVSDWILETCTPISRWIPEHSMHTITPKLVESHVASENTMGVGWTSRKRARTKTRAE